MNIRLILFILIILIGFIFINKRNTRLSRKQFIFIIIGLLVLESSLRGLSVGSDTSVYYYWFINDANSSWHDIWNSIIERYYFKNNDSDAGFLIYNKLISYISDNYSIYLFISSLFFFVPFGILLYRYTKDIIQLIFIFILYVALFNMIAMSGVRKEIALGFSIGAFLFFVNQKYYKSIACIVIGSFIHLSILLALLIPLLSILNIKLLKKLHAVTMLSIPAVILFSSTIIVLMGSMLDNEKYMGYGMQGADGEGITFTVLIELVSLFCFISLNKVDIIKKTYLHHLYTVLPCFTFFAPLITNNGSMIRISQYFHLYIVLLLPYSIDIYFPKSRKVIYIIMLTVLIFLSLRSNNMIYKFIWDDFRPTY